MSAPTADLAADLARRLADVPGRVTASLATLADVIVDRYPADGSLSDTGVTGPAGLGVAS